LGEKPVQIGVTRSVGKRFFFEKKKQKTFPIGARSFGPGENQVDKSFLVLFFKKELLS
jgi:hypothetical protein